MRAQRAHAHAHAHLRLRHRFLTAMDVGRTVGTCWSIEIIARGLFSLELEGAGRGQNLGAAQSRRRRGRAVREMRANGMETPFHPLQITTWFLFPVVTGEYFALLMPVLSPLARYIVTPCYCLFVALSLLSATVTSGIDPHDPRADQPAAELDPRASARARGGGAAAAASLSPSPRARAPRRAVAVSRAPPRLTRSARAPRARARVLALARARRSRARARAIAV